MSQNIWLHEEQESIKPKSVYVSVGATDWLPQFQLQLCENRNYNSGKLLIFIFVISHLSIYHLLTNSLKIGYSFIECI